MKVSGLFYTNDERVKGDKNFTYPLRSSYVTEVESYRDRHRGQLTWNWLCRLTEVEETLPPVKMFNSGIPLSEINL